MLYLYFLITLRKIILCCKNLFLKKASIIFLPPRFPSSFPLPHPPFLLFLFKPAFCKLALLQGFLINNGDHHADEEHSGRSCNWRTQTCSGRNEGRAALEMQRGRAGPAPPSDKGAAALGRRADASGPPL